MNLSNAKIGDEVELYIEDGYVTARKDHSESTLKAIVIGYHAEYNEYILGFKGNESRPKDAYLRSEGNRKNGQAGFKYLEDHGDFLYAYKASIYDRWEVANIKKDLNNWRHWRTEKKGECPCGGNYGVCTYHPVARA